MADWVSYLSTSGMLQSSAKYMSRFVPGGPYLIPALTPSMSTFNLL